MKKYCWLVCVREKYYSGWKFTIVYDKPQPNKQAADRLSISSVSSSSSSYGKDLMREVGVARD